MLARPIIVIGAPRSGTSFLSETLGRHPEVLLLTEPRMVWRFGNDRLSDMFRPEHARPEVIAHIRNEFGQRVLAAGRQRLVEKTPANALRPGFVDRVFPDARFIHIVRDPIESILAIRSFWLNHATGLKNVVAGRFRQRMKELDWRRLPYYAKEFMRRVAPKPLRGALGRAVWGPRLPGIGQMLNEVDLLDVCALQWRLCVEITAVWGRRLPADRYYELRLEDLSHDHLSNIITFAELNDHPSVHEYFNARFKPNRVGGRSDKADPKHIERILELTQSTREWLGYGTN